MQSYRTCCQQASAGLCNLDFRKFKLCISHSIIYNVLIATSVPAAMLQREGNICADML